MKCLKLITKLASFILPVYLALKNSYIRLNMQAKNKKLKLTGKTMKSFSKKLLGHENLKQKKPSILSN